MTTATFVHEFGACYIFLMFYVVHNSMKYANLCNGNAFVDRRSIHKYTYVCEIIAHTYVYIYTYIYTYIHIYIYIYIYI